MKKFALFFFTLMLFTMTGFAQTNKADIDRRIKNPKTAEQAAKADVYILKKQNIDTLDNQAIPSTKKKKAKKNKKS